jgi:hypothetical protein
MKRYNLTNACGDVARDMLDRQNRAVVSCTTSRHYQEGDLVELTCGARHQPTHIANVVVVLASRDWSEPRGEKMHQNILVERAPEYKTRNDVLIGEMPRGRDVTTSELASMLRQHGFEMDRLATTNFVREGLIKRVARGVFRYRGS